jgi:hypothetical protein
MIRRFLCLVAVSMIPAAGRAEGETKLPTSLPPSICSAKVSVEDGQIRVQLSVTKMISYTVTTMVRAEHGFFVPRKSLHHKACTSTAVAIVDGTKVKVCRKSGKAVDPKELPTLLRKEAKVLVFTEGKVDPYYLDVLSDEVLIFAIPADARFPFRPTVDE